MYRKYFGLVSCVVVAFAVATAFCQGTSLAARGTALELPKNLPDPLIFSDGTRVTNEAQWAKRKAELIHLFTEQMYGRMPPRPAHLRFEIFDRDRHALGGKATREQIAIFLDGRKDGPRMDLLVYVPNRVKRPPVILGLNFWGNETVNSDPGIRISQRWIESSHDPFVNLSCVQNNRATEACRGIDARRWPVEKILTAGYALATAYRGDIDPDRKDGFAESLRSAYPALANGGDNFSTIAAWAWALSCGLDYLQTDRLVDRHKVVAFGWSRLGKAAVWAVANDTRFAALISNESGAGGVKLFHHLAGESIHRLNTVFPYWYCRNFRQYDGREADLPFDQNEVLALVEPRPLYIASAIDDRNSDPEGEFLAAEAVTRVYEFFGKTGLPTAERPPLNTPAIGRVSYHVRSGGHDVTDFDWEQYLRFCDLYVKGPSASQRTGLSGKYSGSHLP